MDPPPAPTVWMSSIGTRTGKPSTLASIDIRADGKNLAYHETDYPKGVRKKSELGEYDVYEGAVSISAVLAYDEIKNAKAMTARVTITACNDKVCLKPATITATTK